MKTSVETHFYRYIKTILNLTEKMQIMYYVGMCIIRMVDLSENIFIC